MAQLTKHFSLDEFTFSQTAARMGREVSVDSGGKEEVAISLLCTNVLEPLRERIGNPIRITSGYRPAWLNRAIGGSVTSQHCFGEAADIVVPGMTPMEVATTIGECGVEFDQCIVEFDSWVHVSYTTRYACRLQFLRARRCSMGTHYGLLDISRRVV